MVGDVRLRWILNMQHLETLKDILWSQKRHNGSNCLRTYDVIVKTEMHGLGRAMEGNILLSVVYSF